MRDLRDIKRDAEVATQGPWLAYFGWTCRVDGSPYCPIAHIEERNNSSDAANATFIAAARTDVPDLVAQVEADDALLLEIEPRQCDFCARMRGCGHDADCKLGKRLAEARARARQAAGGAR